MANILIFEVEIANRTVVLGGFSTNGWVTSLSSPDPEEEESHIEVDQDRI